MNFVLCKIFDILQIWAKHNSVKNGDHTMPVHYTTNVCTGSANHIFALKFTFPSSVCTELWFDPQCTTLLVFSLSLTLWSASPCFYSRVDRFLSVRIKKNWSRVSFHRVFRPSIYLTKILTDSNQYNPIDVATNVQMNIQRKVFTWRLPTNITLVPFFHSWVESPNPST